MDVRFSITIRQHKSLRNLIEAIPDADWTPVPYWMDGAADVAQTTYTPFRTEPGAAPVRLIVRRVKPTPGSQLALFATYSYHGFITDGETDWRPTTAATPDRERETRYGVGLNHMPSGRFAANGAWLAVRDTTWPAGRRGSVWASRSRPPRPFGDGSSPWPDGSPARHAASPCICHSAGLGKPSSVAPWHGCERFHSQPDGARPQLTRHPPNRTSPQTRASPVREHLSPRPLPAISPSPRRRRPPPPPYC